MHQGDEPTFDRSRFLRLGAATVAGTALVAAAPARAAVPAPTPQGDDVAYLQFAATTKLVSVSLGATLLRSRGFDAATRKQLTTLRSSDKVHLQRLATVLGEDAPQFGDFDIALPPGGRSRAALIRHATELSGLTAGVHLSGVTDCVDPATRTLLGRLLWSEATHLSTLHALAGRPVATTGLPAPISLDDAAPRLDAYLKDAVPPV